MSTTLCGTPCIVPAIWFRVTGLLYPHIQPVWKGEQLCWQVVKACNS